MTKPHNNRKRVSAKLACEELGVCSQTLRRWAREGKINFILTPGGKYRYDIEAYLDGQQAAPARVAPVNATQVIPEHTEERAPEPPVVAPMLPIDPVAERIRALQAGKSKIPEPMPTLGRSPDAITKS